MSAINNHKMFFLTYFCNAFTTTERKRGVQKPERYRSPLEAIKGYFYRKIDIIKIVITN